MSGAMDVGDSQFDVGLVRPAVVGLTVAGVVALFVFTSTVQRVEAAVSAHLVDLSGITGARAVGNTVLFGTRDGLAGYDISLGCTVSVLLAPFFVVTVGLLSIARVSVLRAAASLLCAVTVISAVNQVRLLVIATGMHAWGARLGYSRTHVLVGTVISTVGLVLAGVAYLVVLLGLRRRPQPATGDRRDG